MTEKRLIFPSRRLASLANRDVSRRSSVQLPSGVVRDAARRLRIVCLITIAVVAITWFLLSLVSGDLHYEWQTPYQWGPPVTMLAASAVTYALARGPRFPVSWIQTLGMTYEVIVSWCIPLSVYWGAFENVPAAAISADLTGVSIVGIWVMFFAVIVPAWPSHALFAMLLSVAGVPATYAYLVAIGDAPSIGPGRFVDSFVTPYVIVVVMAYVAARIVFGLGRQVGRATELGSYRLIDLIGKGGMGEVWKAQHNLLARPAAIKLIRSDALGDDLDSAETRTSRFEREAQVTATLQSPHTVHLFDFGVADDGTLYYVMELLEGVDLEFVVVRFGPVVPERVVHILIQVCRSLDEAHQLGLVHRDIKPANIYLGRYALEYDFVKVLDFGLVRRHTAFTGDDRPSLTAAGTFAGTPGFLSPEAALGRKVDQRADIYAVGCVAFWLLTGRVLFEEDTPMAMVVAHVNNEPTTPSALSELPIPTALDELVLDCLAKSPDDRPQTAEDLASRLAQISFENPWTNERAATWWRSHRPAESERAT